MPGQSLEIRRSGIRDIRPSGPSECAVACGASFTSKVPTAFAITIPSLAAWVERCPCRVTQPEVRESASTQGRAASEFLGYPPRMRVSLRNLTLAVLLGAVPWHPADGKTIRVFAASSLTEALEDIANLYRAQNPGDEVEFNFGGSQLLRVQIEEGAEADVFASADSIHMTALSARGIVGRAVCFATNRLVVVTPKNSPKVRSLADLARPGLQIVIADPNVPVGTYAHQVLANMDRAKAFGKDFQKRAMANIVSQEPNVRSVLAKVTLDEVDAGFVYVTDAKQASAQVLALEIPDSVNVIARYPIAVVTRTKHRTEAERFVETVLGADSMALLSARGFQLEVDR